MCAVNLEHYRDRVRNPVVSVHENAHTIEWGKLGDTVAISFHCACQFNCLSDLCESPAAVILLFTCFQLDRFRQPALMNDWIMFEHLRRIRNEFSRPVVHSIQSGDLHHGFTARF